VYDGSSATVLTDANFSLSGFVNNDSATINGSINASYEGASAGLQGISASLKPSDFKPGPATTLSNYILPDQASGTGTITKATLQISALADSKTYDANPYSGRKGFTYQGFVNGEGPAVLSQQPGYGGSAQGAVDAGLYLITPSGAAAANYNIQSVSGSLAIAKADLQVKANDARKTYDAITYSGANGLSFQGFVAGESENVLQGVVQYGGTAQGAKNAGSYRITPAGLRARNYNLQFVDGTLVIDPASLLISANPDSKVYDAQAYSGGNGVTYQGLVDGTDKIALNAAMQFAGNAQGARNAGSYTITPFGASSPN
jgi:hypothetical protein